MDREKLQQEYDGKFADLMGRSEINHTQRRALEEHLRQNLDILLDPDLSEGTLNRIADILDKALDLDKVSEQVGSGRSDLYWLKALVGSKVPPDQILETLSKKDEISFQVRDMVNTEGEAEE